jgi:DNA repair protein RadC
MPRSKAPPVPLVRETVRELAATLTPAEVEHLFTVLKDLPLPRLKPIRGPEDVLAYCRDLPHLKREHFVVLLLNARHEVQARQTVSIGSLNASIVHPREVFRPAVVHAAAAVVLVHNHPSGDPEPSEEDLSITKRLVSAGELLGVTVLDHVIVAGRGFVSLRARNLL